MRLVTAEAAGQSGRRVWARSLLLAIALFAAGTGSHAAEKAEAVQRVLIPAGILSGARLAAAIAPGVAAPGGQSAAAHINFLAPIAVAASGGIVYIADAGRRQIFRYDAAQLALTAFADAGNSGVAGIAAGADLSLFVADADARRVRHFSWDGRALPKLSSDIDLGRPVAVVPDEAGGRVLVADSLYNRVAVFSGLGHLLSVLKPDVTRSIYAMARGPDGMYLVDRIERQVAVLGMDGRDRYAFGADALKMPAAIAVDRFNRVFVADQFDDTLKIFAGGKLVATAGGSGNAPGSFHRVTSLAIDRDILYAADSGNSRIQMFRILPPKEEGKHD